MTIPTTHFFATTLTHPAYIHTSGNMSGDGMLKPEKDFSGVLDEQLPEILASAKVRPTVTRLLRCEANQTSWIDKPLGLYGEAVGFREADKTGPYGLSLCPALAQLAHQADEWSLNSTLPY